MALEHIGDAQPPHDHAELFGHVENIGEVVYVEVPGGKPIFDENARPLEFKDLPRDRLVTVEYAGKLERPAPEPLRESGMRMITVFWAERAQVLHRTTTAPTSSEDERKPE